MNDNDELVTVLKCDVELNFTGPIPALVNKRAATVLRVLADRLEMEYSPAPLPGRSRPEHPIRKIARCSFVKLTEQATSFR